MQSGGVQDPELCAFVGTTRGRPGPSTDRPVLASRLRVEPPKQARFGPFWGTETSLKTLNARAELAWQSRQTHEAGPGAVFVVVGSRNGNSRRASKRLRGHH